MPDYGAIRAILSSGSIDAWSVERGIRDFLTVIRALNSSVSALKGPNLSIIGANVLGGFVFHCK